MQDFERLGAFYLGRRYDPEKKQTTDDLILYDSKDLVTHALCVGMTGSGKTGLGIATIEEAAIDGVPVIVIDPKGDLTNLLLTFPGLTAADFAPWVDEDDARRHGKSPAEFAADQAEKWKAGLAEWGQDGGRIKRLKDAAEFRLYTPGSTAGSPVSAITSLARPEEEDAEGLRERAQTVVSSLLALVGLDVDPLKSPEHILLTTILVSAWQAGESPDLPTLIHRIQQPPMTKIGVMDVEGFFPAKDRMTLALAINGLLASPGFEVWSEGEPLDIASFLRSESGKPRVSVFSIAHLDDSQRMFFVALLLNAVAGWMRGQTGTSSLRAMLYMDEIFGFFPPIANPPSKGPLLTLLKQGRAEGLGVVLATQNPVDLDYKGLSNIGTWWLGRLQTERDKQRVLDGLESASASANVDRHEVDRLLSALGPRIFLMRNVHEDGLELFQTRWTLSYLRGPLGRNEIKKLTGEQKSQPVAAARTEAAAPAGHLSAAAQRPVTPPNIRQYFAPDAGGASTPLRPVVYGAANVRFVDSTITIDSTKLVRLAAPISNGAIAVDWENAGRVEWAPEMLDEDAPEGAQFADLPAAAFKAKNYEQWTKQLSTLLASTEAIELFRSPSTGELSRVDESEREFRSRLQQTSREGRDRELDILRRKFAPRQSAIQEKLRRAQQAVDRESEQATGQKLQTAISVGATLVGALFGRKTISVGTIGRATTAARGVGRSMKESEDIERARQTVSAIEEQRRQLDEEFAAQSAKLSGSADVATEPLEKVTIKSKKSNISVKLVALVWTK